MQASVAEFGRPTLAPDDEQRASGTSCRHARFLPNAIANRSGDAIVVRGETLVD
jgi:hypothetical protein